MCVCVILNNYYSKHNVRKTVYLVLLFCCHILISFLIVADSFGADYQCTTQQFCLKPRCLIQ